MKCSDYHHPHTLKSFPLFSKTWFWGGSSFPKGDLCPWFAQSAHLWLVSSATRFLSSLSVVVPGLSGHAVVDEGVPPIQDKAVGTADHEEGVAGLGGTLGGSPSLSNGKLVRLADSEESDELLGKTRRSSGE